jgi:hypothetical protein
MSRMKRMYPDLRLSKSKPTGERPADKDAYSFPARMSCTSPISRTYTQTAPITQLRYAPADQRPVRTNEYGVTIMLNSTRVRIAMVVISRCVMEMLLCPPNDRFRCVRGRCNATSGG